MSLFENLAGNALLATQDFTQNLPSYSSLMETSLMMSVLTGSAPMNVEAGISSTASLWTAVILFLQLPMKLASGYFYFGTMAFSTLLWFLFPVKWSSVTTDWFTQLIWWYEAYYYDAAVPFLYTWDSLFNGVTSISGYSIRSLDSGTLAIQFLIFTLLTPFVYAGSSYLYPLVGVMALYWIICYFVPSLNMDARVGSIYGNQLGL